MRKQPECDYFQGLGRIWSGAKFDWESDRNRRRFHDHASHFGEAAGLEDFEIFPGDRGEITA